MHFQLLSMHNHKIHAKLKFMFEGLVVESLTLILAKSIFPSWQSKLSNKQSKEKFNNLTKKLSGYCLQKFF